MPPHANLAPAPQRRENNYGLNHHNAANHPTNHSSVLVPDDDLLLTDEPPLFHSRPPAPAHNVVAQEVVVQPKEKKKKKSSKAAANKMVEGIVEYDLPGFPEDGVVPTDPLNPHHVNAVVGCSSSVAASGPLTHDVNPVHGIQGVSDSGLGGVGVSNGVGGTAVGSVAAPAAVGGERAQAGVTGGHGPVFPCSTPGLIRDADTIRSLCLDFIDHLITTNRGKITIPRSVAN